MRINVCCLFGAIVAFICLALPWSGQVWHPYQGYIDEYGLSDEIEMRSGHEPYERTTFALVALLIGASVSLFTPLGGLILLLAVADYYAEIGGHVGTYQTPGPQHIHFFLDVGFFIAVWATVLICLSAVVPFGVGYSGAYSPFSRWKLSARERLLVWTSSVKALSPTGREDSGFPVKLEDSDVGRPWIPNKMALLSLISASVLLVLALSTRGRHFGTDYDIAGIIWALSGLTIFAAALYSIRDDAYSASDDGWTAFVAIWAGMIGLVTTVMLVSWSNLQHEFAKAMLFTMFTSALWVLGLVFVLWGRLKGNLGALSKWMTFSVGIPFLIFAVYFVINLLYFSGFAT